MEQSIYYSQDDDRITDEIVTTCEDRERECESYEDVREGESYEDDEEHEVIQNNLKNFMSGVAKKMVPIIIKKKFNGESDEENIIN